MTKSKSLPGKRAASLAAARNAGGDRTQSHWMDRLKAVMKRRATAKKKPAAR